MRYSTKQFLRENLLGLSLTLMGLLCLALASVVYLGHADFPRFALAGGPALDDPAITSLEAQSRDYERIAEVVTPAIVNIRTTHIVKFQQSPFFLDPFLRQFFGDTFGEQFVIPREQREHALGSR